MRDELEAVWAGFTSPPDDARPRGEDMGLFSSSLTGADQVSPPRTITPASLLPAIHNSGLCETASN